MGTDVKHTVRDNPGSPDKDAFVSAVEAIYGAAAQPSNWPAALQAIADCTGDVGAVLLYRRTDESFGAIVSPSLDAAQRDYERHWWQHDIRSIRGIPILNHLDAGTDRHVVSDDEVRTHPIYTQFLIPHGLGWFGAVGISPDPSIVVLISVQRTIKKPRFSDEDLAVIVRLGKHAEQSLRLSIRLMGAELAVVGLKEALGRVGAGVFVLDGNGGIVFSNSEAERLLDDGLMLSNGRLTARFGSDRTNLSSAIDEAMNMAVPQPRPILLQRTKAERALIAYVLPLPSVLKSVVDQFLTQARMILLVIDPEQGAMPDPALVRDLLGITLGEARVAALIGSGLPPREAAEVLGITEETARTTLKRVFAKVGVSRQSELAALLTKLVLR